MCIIKSAQFSPGTGTEERLSTLGFALWDLLRKSVANLRINNNKSDKRKYNLVNVISRGRLIRDDYINIKYDNIKINILILIVTRPLCESFDQIFSHLAPLPHVLHPPPFFLVFSCPLSIGHPTHVSLYPGRSRSLPALGKDRIVPLVSGDGAINHFVQVSKVFVDVEMWDGRTGWRLNASCYGRCFWCSCRPEKKWFDGEVLHIIIFICCHVDLQLLITGSAIRSFVYLQSRHNNQHSDQNSNRYKSKSYTNLVDLKSFSIFEAISWMALTFASMSVTAWKPYLRDLRHLGLTGNFLKGNLIDGKKIPK